MTRKDFIAIAATIKGLDLRFVSGGTEGERDGEWDRWAVEAQRKGIAEAFADMLEAQNERFNRDLFVQAATSQVPLNAREARLTTGCRNCGGETDRAHTDMCCMCFGIAFGVAEHHTEHSLGRSRQSTGETNETS